MKAKKKPVVVDVMQYTNENARDLAKFIGGGILEREALVDGKWQKSFYINTLEGTMTARVGDYIIKGVNGEFYPCKPDIFGKTYEVIEE